MTGQFTIFIANYIAYALWCCEQTVSVIEYSYKYVSHSSNITDADHTIVRSLVNQMPLTAWVAVAS